MTEKTITENVKSTVQNVAVSVAVLALAWAPFAVSAGGERRVPLRQNYTAVIQATGVFAPVRTVRLAQQYNSVAGVHYYALVIDGERIILNVNNSSACQSQVVASAHNPQEFSLAGVLTHRQHGRCSAVNVTELGLTVEAIDSQGQRHGVLRIRTQVQP